MKTAERPLTVEDYLAMPEGGPRYQLIEGELYVAPAPNRFHQEIVGNMHMILRDYLRQRPRGKVYLSPFDVYLDEINVFQPDLLFVSKKNADVLTKDGAHGAPDWVCEILSPSTSRLDREQKRRVYARLGVEELWIIVPEKKKIEVYRLQEDAANPAAIYGNDAVFESEIFPHLRFEAVQIFAE